VKPALSIAALALASCTRASGPDVSGAAQQSAPSTAHATAHAAPHAGPRTDVVVDRGPAGAPTPRVTSPDAQAARPPPRSTGVDGPHEILLEPGRPIYYARPREADGAASLAGAKPWRLVGHLHGMCGAPSYACGKWIGAAADVGVLVCPTGNATCGDSPLGPPSWEAPTWQELVVAMDRDLEASIAKVEAKHPGTIRRDGAVLTGYSRGAYAAPVIARRHPGRWPYLVLIEANVPLSPEGLRASGVRAVALVAGEQGTEIAGERKTESALVDAGVRAHLFVMPKTGHLYSDNMEQVMSEALAFVLGSD
jgi:predicted esterase